MYNSGKDVGLICFFLLLVQLMLFQTFSGLFAQQCGRESSIYGMMLQRHIFKVMRTSNSLRCLQGCSGDVRCQSFNYDMANDICELNNSTKEARPEDFVPNISRYYYGTLGKTDVDECLSGIHECIKDLATCVNTVGSYRCVCNHGYIGDGKTSCITIPDECRSYMILTSKTRKITYVTGFKYCDSYLGPGWFRFKGDAGTMMPTECQPVMRCGTYGTGWLNGTHPTVTEGIVNRRVCFRYTSLRCCEYSVVIRVRNCGLYYVYHLNKTPRCNLGYCGTNL